MNRLRLVLAGICGAGSVVASATTSLSQPPDPGAREHYLEEVHVQGQDRSRAVPVPSTSITAQELESINLTTVEDALIYAPNLTIRRRYIGDPNGSLGIRGSNMFQTARVLVYADGLPLHYHLQTRWSGAPRWSLVAPSEVASVDILYGPFSAAYSGNAMGGVVRITTVEPTEQTLEVEGALFAQDYEQLATDEIYGGGRLSVTYGDKFDDLTLFTFYNHLQNKGQPMTQFFAAPDATENPEATPVTGAISGYDSHGNDVLYYGDSGAAGSVTDLFKTKVGYRWGDYRVQGTVAYEDRRGDLRGPNSYLRDESGHKVWSGSVRVDESTYTLSGGNFGIEEQDRQSLLAGIGLEGPVAKSWRLDLNLSHFAILQDEQNAFLRNPADPAFSAAGQLTAFDDTGWTTADLALSTHGLGNDDSASLSMGAHFSRYSLEIRTWNSYEGAKRGDARTASGGSTTTQAVFAEYLWPVNPVWELSLGGRYEYWRATDGFVGAETHPDRQTDGFSPKFSLTFTPHPQWSFRYSLARALRFPLVEELYQNVSRAGTEQTANAQLQPEDGLHHNLMLERVLHQGFIRLNLFQENIEDVIFNQLGIVDGTEISSFLGIDRVRTRGAELIVNQPGFADSRMDLRFNLSYLDAEIKENNVNPSVEGNDFPRLPRWQSNLLLTYHLSDDWRLAGGIRYASKSFGELDNSDGATRTFGAFDSYIFVNAKAQWQVNTHLDLALGVDNLTNQTAYVHHPWPSRTIYLEAGYAF